MKHKLLIIFIGLSTTIHSLFPLQAECGNARSHPDRSCG